MKNLDTTKKTQSVEENYSLNSIEYGDIVVYNEMADQTSVKLNLIEQIHAQLNQLEEMTQKRQFMMKEVLQYIAE